MRAGKTRTPGAGSSRPDGALNAAVISPTGATAAESHITVLSSAAALAAAVAALLFFGTTRAVGWSLSSVGSAAAILGGILGGALFVATYIRGFDRGELGADGAGGGVRIARRVLDTAALALNHVALWLVVSLGGSYLLERAFLGLVLHAAAAAVLAGAAVGCACFAMQASARSITASRVATLLSLFIVCGMLASMISASNSQWWMRSFSSLGTVPGFSGVAFNATLVITGALAITLADYLASELRRWAAVSRPAAAWGASRVEAGLVLLGLGLAGVGLLPVNRFAVAHGISALSLLAVFVLLVSTLPLLLPGLPRTFFVLGYAALLSIAAAAALYFAGRVLGFTALELLCAAVILGWIVLFIRMVAALGRDTDAATPASTRRAGTRRDPAQRTLR